MHITRDPTVRRIPKPSTLRVPVSDSIQEPPDQGIINRIRASIGLLRSLEAVKYVSLDK